MNRNTPTQLYELRLGDRFYRSGDKQKVVLQVTGKLGRSVYYNQVMENGRKALMYDKPAPADMAVIFVRHTRPLPGDECMIQDLQQGDIFFMPKNIIVEYRMDGMIAGSNDAFVMELPNTPHYMSSNTTVVFVRTEATVKL